ncbi:MAG: peptide ABC transporter substrate-binding protein [Chloroflexota bacterium]|nr:MAG: peptide ABC transporter substrate-binding protein [Chloroflexota bacterium]
MRIDLRWQLLLAVICIALLGSILGYQVQSVGLCTTRVAASGGQIVEGLVGRPQYLNPLLSHENPVDSHLADLVFDGLVRYGPDGGPLPALASGWDVSDDGRTFTFDLRDDARWHDGRPVTTADVAFTFRLLQDESVPAQESLQELWQEVVISPTTASQISFILPQPYGAFIEATTLGIVPEHLLGDVAPEDIAGHDYSRAPVGTGPFMVASGNDWQDTGYLRLAPNPLHWRQGLRIDFLEFRFFEDLRSLIAAMSSDEIQAITSVPVSGITEIGALEGVRLFSAPAPRYSQLLFNMTGSGSDALGEVAIRKALAMGLDRDALVDRALDGQGLLLEGPYLPRSWAFVPNKVQFLAYQPESAAAQLETGGWTLLEGRDVRQKDGQNLILRLLLVDEPRFRALAAAAADMWAEIGVGTEIVAVPFEEFNAALAERAFDLAIVDVDPGNDPDLYDFWSQEAIVRGQNYGGWNNRRASEALENARRLAEQQERRPYYEAFQSYFDEDLPALTLYQHVYTYGLSSEVREADIGRIDSPRGRYDTLDQWFLLFREVASACPEAGE